MVKISSSMKKVIAAFLFLGFGVLTGCKINYEQMAGALEKEVDLATKPAPATCTPNGVKASMAQAEKYKTYDILSLLNDANIARAKYCYLIENPPTLVAERDTLPLRQQYFESVDVASVDDQRGKTKVSGAIQKIQALSDSANKQLISANDQLVNYVAAIYKDLHKRQTTVSDLNSNQYKANLEHARLDYQATLFELAKALRLRCKKDNRDAIDELLTKLSAQ